MLIQIDRMKVNVFDSNEAGADLKQISNRMGQCVVIGRSVYDGIRHKTDQSNGNKLISISNMLFHPFSGSGYSYFVAKL